MSLQQREKNPSILLNERFMWNYAMMKPLIKQNISQPWHLQLIQGYIGNFTTNFTKDLTVKYLLISRRSVHRSGTRCNHRGNISKFPLLSLILLRHRHKRQPSKLRGTRVDIYFQPRWADSLPHLSERFTAHSMGAKRYQRSDSPCRRRTAESR